MSEPSRRPYRQTTRADASRAVRSRIAETFYELLAERWIDEVTLDEVAAAAQTTRRTVLRMFASKEGLIGAVAEIVEQQAQPRFEVPIDRGTDAALRALLDDYEVLGDMVYRLLAQEDRHPTLRPLLAEGRRRHRAWVMERLGQALPPSPESNRRALQLIAATDVYTWKLLRRDLVQTYDEVKAIMGGTIESLMGVALS